MKKLVIPESELTNIIQKAVEKKLIEQDFTIEPQISKTPRETELENVFGKYSGEIPADIVRYMRKNPKIVINRLLDIYGPKMLEYMTDMVIDDETEPINEDSADENKDGIISPDELYRHFDLDKDGVVTMEDYAAHVDFHCENPDLLQPYRETEEYISKMDDERDDFVDFFNSLEGVDFHNNVVSEQFDEDRKAMIQRAKKAGVSRFFIPAIDSNYIQKMYALESDYPENVFLMMGLHPTYVKDNYLDELQIVEQELATRKFYAIGEIGIDLYWDKTHLKEQQIAFRRQIQLAKKYKLPIVIHCREAFDEIFEILEEEKSADLFGIFHCFTGTLEQAHQAISYNMKLGIGGVATFKNGKIDQFLNQIDLKHIVLETDAPYLSPVPFRGKRNESSYILNVIEKLSNIYGVSNDYIAEMTTQNSKSVFKL